MFLRTVLLIALLPGCRLLNESEQADRAAEFDRDGDGASGINGGDDCDDDDPSVGPGATELCDGIDQDCDGEIDEGALVEGYDDGDGDGYGSGDPRLGCPGDAGFTEQTGDCDDSSATTNPGATEACDEVDNDCNGAVDDNSGNVWHVDSDGDGYGDPDLTSDSCDGGGSLVADSTDCDDTASSVHPGADEVCNGGDEDCDGTIDEDAIDAVTWYEDADGDGIGGDTTVVACSPPVGGYWTEISGDCDDSNLEVAPGAQELCDALDNDCDGDIDETAPTWFVDADDDGFGDDSLTETGCDQPTGFVANDNDCDDGDASIRPTGTEVCNGSDDDCDGAIDDDDSSLTGEPTWYADGDGDGHGHSASPAQACDAPSGFVSSDDDCDDSNATVSPSAAEVCNGVDDDCDGGIDDGLPTVDYFVDDDGDGYGEEGGAAAPACSDPGSGWSTSSDDCDDAEDTTHPGATESCDGVDNNCSGDETDHPSWQDWYADTDADTYGDPTSATADCAQPSGHVDDSADCDDDDASLNPDTEWWPDTDSDGHGAGSPVTQCAQPASHVRNATDCDDGDATRHPGATLACDDASDKDCDGAIDNDADDDSFSDDACGGTDCDDSNGSVFPGGGCLLGDSSGKPGLDCKDIHDAGDSVGDGVYWIDPNGGSVADSFEVYCDMTRQGGGWTLVYAYTFTSYNPFVTGGNATTPIPNWTFSTTTVPVSTTPPLATDDFNAIDFALWSSIGTDFMVTSTINDHLVCSPGTGSLATLTNGTISCTNVLDVATTCVERPNRIGKTIRGPYLSIAGQSLYYYWDGDQVSNWPTHDPCGTNAPNQKTGVGNPEGQIWLRR